MPEAARASMYWKKGWPVGTSLNVAAPGAGLTTRFHQTSAQPKNWKFGLEPF
jgi:hypothetical protein